MATADAADDSEGIADLLQLLPETVRAAVQTYLASRGDTSETTGEQQISRCPFPYSFTECLNACE